jgi:DNA-binding MarR family transcriptional regulator
MKLFLRQLDLLHPLGVSVPGYFIQTDGIQPQSLTRLLADSKTEGFIKRKQDQADKRRCLIEITPAGSRLLVEEARKRESSLAAAMTRVLTPTEQELVRIAGNLMDRLADAIEPEGLSAVKIQGEETL